jgi:hypothetical protein
MAGISMKVWFDLALLAVIFVLLLVLINRDMRG